MEDSDSHAASSKLWLLLPAFLVVAAILTVQSDQAGTSEPVGSATYTRGVLRSSTPESLARPVFNRDQPTWCADLAAALRSASPRNTVPFFPAMRAVVPVLL